jgi:hypothetical protein
MQRPTASSASVPILSNGLLASSLGQDRDTFGNIRIDYENYLGTGVPLRNKGELKFVQAPAQNGLPSVPSEDLLPVSVVWTSSLLPSR